MFEITMTVIGLGYGCFMFARAMGLVNGRFKGELTPNQMKQQKVFCLMIGTAFTTMGLIYGYEVYLG